MTNKKAERDKRSLFQEKDSSDTEKSRLEVSAHELYELAVIMENVLEFGGMFSCFKSRDQNAYCVRVKFGKETRSYWRGKSDDPMKAIDGFYEDTAIDDITTNGVDYQGAVPKGSAK